MKQTAQNKNPDWSYRVNFLGLVMYDFMLGANFPNMTEKGLDRLQELAEDRNWMIVPKFGVREISHLRLEAIVHSALGRNRIPGICLHVNIENFTAISKIHAPTGKRIFLQLSFMDTAEAIKSGSMTVLQALRDIPHRESTTVHFTFEDEDLSWESAHRLFNLVNPLINERKSSFVFQLPPNQSIVECLPNHALLFLDFRREANLQSETARKAGVERVFAFSDLVEEDAWTNAPNEPEIPYWDSLSNHSGRGLISRLRQNLFSEQEIFEMCCWPQLEEKLSTVERQSMGQEWI